MTANAHRLIAPLLATLAAFIAPNPIRGQEGSAADDLSELELVVLTPAEISAAAELDFQRSVRPTFVDTCFGCHSGKDLEGDLDIESLLRARPLVRNAARWSLVVSHIENRSMPPADADQPSDVSRRMLAAWLRNELENFDYASIENPGYEAARRLTREEYNNTIRDLFGIDLRPADRLPEDLSGTSGFDNSSNTLFVDGTLLEKYSALAEYTVDKILPAAPRSPKQEQLFRRVVTCPTATVSALEAAARTFQRLLPRAYRAPMAHEDLQLALERFEAFKSQGDSFEESIRGTLQTILISPKFLFHFEETRHAADPFAIDSHDVANRLSYFLWASMPDGELFELAAAEELSKPAVVRQQVERMLDDSRADTLGTLFAAQWLGFQHLGSRIRADPIDNPWCTDTLMDAMKAESALHFVWLLRQDERLHALVDAKHTFLNEELAKFYRIKGVVGNRMRRVRLDTEARGGIFGQASLLAVTSFPGRTSPVVRGTWILSDVLGTPPPPPPPNVSEFDEDVEEREELSRRAKMELHRRIPACHACHSQIDPLGFALENYDWFGRYREQSGRRRIDTSTQLPDGTKFDGATGLKQVILERRIDDLLKQLTRKMLSYALGRQLEYYDEAAVRKIVAAVQDRDYRLRTLIAEVAMSYPFLFKQVQPVPQPR